MATRDEREHEIAELEHRFQTAVATRDLEFLDHHLGDEFTLTTGRTGAEVRSRSEWLEITSTRYRIEHFSFEELNVLDYDHVAVVRSRYVQRGSMDGQDRSQPFLMTDVWVRRGERWQLTTRHVSPLQPSRETRAPS
jgi:ketosteroid isomerase-like protein